MQHILHEIIFILSSTSKAIALEIFIHGVTASPTEPQLYFSY